MSEHLTPPTEKESKASAGAAGIGGGTLLIMVANSLPEGNKIKPWLVWAAPSVSVVLTAVWLWIQVKIANWVQEREVNKLIKKTREQIDIAINNPNTSSEHREAIKQKLEKLELVAIDRNMQHIDLLKVISSSDVASKSQAMQ